ncbi:MAG: NAD(P)-binding domain-containing protein [Thermoanaerobaculia bacterium]|nr:NAD(P)-binding domain-containing protein [Thermoanaerobaculia bacterium]
MKETEVLIVGAGPIGIELAVALKRRGIPFIHLDAGQIGATITWYAPNTHFFSSPERIEIAGVPLQTLDQTKATKEEYLKYLRSVVLQFDLEVVTFERVRSIRKIDGHFEVTSHGMKGDRRWRASKIVLAIGDMHRPRMLGVAGENLPHVSHYFGDPHEYFRRRVLIVGGKNSAVEAAIRCVRIGANVTLSYRGSEFDPERVKFWLLPEIEAMIRDERMTFIPRSNVLQIKRDVVLLARTTEDGDNEELRVPADVVLLLTGYEQDSTLFEQAGVELEGPGRKPVFDEKTMETNVPGLYVAGTASAGTQLEGVKEFIETSHVHVDRIVASITGARAPELEAPEYTLPES